MLEFKTPQVGFCTLCIKKICRVQKIKNKKFPLAFSDFQYSRLQDTDELNQFCNFLYCQHSKCSQCHDSTLTELTQPHKGNKKLPQLRYELPGYCMY